MSGSGRCERCHRRWIRWWRRNRRIEHVTHYGAGSGIFALCERCWGELTPEDRIPFYFKLWVQWSKSPEEWSAIVDAIWAGR